MVWNPVSDWARNEAHRYYPLTGDMWEDHMVYCCIVLEVNEHSVAICQDKKQVDDNYWTWDLTKVKTVTRAEFETLFLYDSHKNVKGARCWASVVPEKGLEFALDWQKDNTATPSRTPIRDNYR